MNVIRTNTLGLRVDAVTDALPDHQLLDFFEANGSPVLFTFVNPGAVAVARRQDDYRDLLARFDAVLPDGIGMCWAMRLLHGLRAARVSFDSTSLAPAVMQWATANRFKVALVGGQPGIARRAADQILKAWPGLAITLVLDGFGDRAAKISQIVSTAPDVVICGMGVGEQERFLLSLADAGWTGFGFTCGGYFDQLTNGLRYYPRWVDAANLRWAYRLVREPRRLARRYMVDYVLFAARMIHDLCSRQSVRKQTRPLAPAGRGSGIADL